MLHAFNAEDGTERWAYVPGAVMPNLYKLADAAYESNHRYFVDGSPAIADFCAANCTNTSAPLPDWRTILVGGFNSGGRGFYAQYPARLHYLYSTPTATQPLPSSVMARGLSW